MSHDEEYDFGEAPDAEFEEIGPGSSKGGLVKSTSKKSKPSKAVSESDDAEATGDIAQYAMLSYLTSNTDLWIHCAPILKSEYFDPEFGPVIDYVRDFEQEYSRLPSKLMIHSETGIRLEEPDDAKHPDTFDVIAKKAEKFCRHRALFQWLVNSSENITIDSEERVFQQLETQVQDIINIKLMRDMGFEVHQGTREALKRAEKMDGISTGFNHLDDALDGGVTMPSFNLVSAGSGDGKSIMLQNLAVNYAEMGYNVVFYTLELEPEMIMKRFAAMMTNTHIGFVYRDVESVAKSMDNRAVKEGKIWLHKMKMSGTTVADIRAHYNNLMMDSQLDWPVIIVDYMDVMSPIADVRADNIHLKDKHIAEEMNDFAHDKRLSKIVWSASQQTKGAEDEKDARKGAVSGGTGKVNTCDNLIILKRTTEDQQEQRTWAHIQKGRSSGAKGMKVPIHWNGDTMRMTDGPDELFIEANPMKFDRKSGGKSKGPSDRVKKDALMNDNKSTTGKARSGSKTQNTLVDRFKKK